MSKKYFSFILFTFTKYTVLREYKFKTNLILLQDLFYLIAIFTKLSKILGSSIQNKMNTDTLQNVKNATTHFLLILS